MQFHFILVNPARGENVGFAARALKTLGFDTLSIVGNSLQHSVSARKTGYQAHHLLDQVRNYNSLEQALSGMDLAIGTTAKQRIKRYDPHPPQKVRQILARKRGTLKQVGVVFGSEENGLSTAELDLCDLISTIPLTVDYPSLNLAQSVLIYAWELSGLTPEHHQIPEPDQTPDNPQLQKLLKDEIAVLMHQLGLSDKPLLIRRIMDRILLLNADDSELLMTILSKLKRKL